MWQRRSRSKIRQDNKRNADEILRRNQDATQRNNILRRDAMETKRREYRQKAVQSLRLL